MIDEPSQEIMRLSITALRERVQQELQENPVLDFEEQVNLDRIADETTKNTSVPESGQGAWPRLAVLPWSEELEDDSTDPDPDVVVDRRWDGNHEVEVLDDSATRLSISSRYAEMFHRHDCDPKAKAYLQRKIGTGQRLIESLRQRRSLLAEVTRAIVERQRSYFDSDSKSIKPLTTQQIADGTGLSLGTVEALVANKSVKTPHGVLPLERFFLSS